MVVDAREAGTAARPQDPPVADIFVGKNALSVRGVEPASDTRTTPALPPVWMAGDPIPLVTLCVQYLSDAGGNTCSA